ncbi:MAG: hypothetical protein WCJ44_05780 [Runella sp.]
MQHFDTINTCGIHKEEALKLALASEQQRDFSPTINGITIGLSSGTSGNRGLFLASQQERAEWVAAILDRVIGARLKKRKAAFFCGPTVTFILRFTRNCSAFVFLICFMSRVNILNP